MSDGEIDVFEELSGVAFGSNEKAPSGLGNLLGGAGMSMLGPAGMMAGMMGGGGLDLSSSAESKAISGGPFTSGEVVLGRGKYDIIVIGAVVVFGLLIVFGGKK